jgi:hypothetical protein
MIPPVFYLCRSLQGICCDVPDFGDVRIRKGRILQAERHRSGKRLQLWTVVGAILFGARSRYLSTDRTAIPVDAPMGWFQEINTICRSGRRLQSAKGHEAGTGYVAAFSSQSDRVEWLWSLWHVFQFDSG